MDKCCDLRDPKIVAAIVILSIGFIFMIVGASVGFSTKYLLKKDGATLNGSNGKSSNPSVRRLNDAGNCTQQEQSIHLQRKQTDLLPSPTLENQTGQCLCQLAVVFAAQKKIRLISEYF